MSNMSVESGQKLSISEQEFGKKIDRCFADTVIKGSGGLFVGSILSLLFLKRRAWPLVFGTGFGIGVAYRTCERELNS